MYVVVKSIRCPPLRIEIYRCEISLKPVQHFSREIVTDGQTERQADRITVEFILLVWSMHYHIILSCSVFISNLPVLSISTQPGKVTWPETVISQMFEFRTLIWNAGMWPHSKYNPVFVMTSVWDMGSYILLWYCLLALRVWNNVLYHRKFLFMPFKLMWS